MHTTNLRKVGGSVMLAVPPAILDVLQLQAGATVGVTVEDGRLVIEPQRRPHYTLDELLAQSAPATEIPMDEHDWVAGKPVGEELI